MSRSTDGRTALLDHLVARIVLYYATLTLAVLLAWRWVPDRVQRAVLQSYAPLLLNGDQHLSAALQGKRAALEATITPPPEPIALAVAGATIGAFALMLPVSWTYMLTREKKGYRQSTVHTLLLLPVVVAGVVVLVKSSLALAFSLAGIVAAVRFRNSLDDSKDATFLFLATGVGLAAGVELDVAVVLSVLFVVATLSLFYTDFARMPPALEGERARRQLERALAIANRTSQFVAVVDEEVLRTMGPEQLDALAGRVRRRREELGQDLPSVTELEYDARLRFVTTDAVSARPLVETVLDARCKRWARIDEVPNGPDGDVLTYHVRWKKGHTPAMVLEGVRTEAAPFVVRTEIA